MEKEEEEEGNLRSISCVRLVVSFTPLLLLGEGEGGKGRTGKSSYRSYTC